MRGAARTLHRTGNEMPGLATANTWQVTVDELLDAGGLAGRRAEEVQEQAIALLGLVVLHLVP